MMQIPLTRQPCLQGFSSLQEQLQLALYSGTMSFAGGEQFHLHGGISEGWQRSEAEPSAGKGILVWVLEVSSLNVGQPAGCAVQASHFRAPCKGAYNRLTQRVDKTLKQEVAVDDNTSWEMLGRKEKDKARLNLFASFG